MRPKISISKLGGFGFPAHLVWVTVFTGVCGCREVCWTFELSGLVVNEIMWSSGGCFITLIEPESIPQLGYVAQMGGSW